MKRTLIAASLVALSFSAFADEGGFKPGETAPPAHKQDSGYKGTEDTHENTIKKIRSLKEGSWITLEGNILKQQQGEQYQFRDKTDTIIIDVPQAVWKGKEVEADELIRISGRVKGQGDNAVVHVERLGDP